MGLTGEHIRIFGEIPIKNETSLGVAGVVEAYCAMSTQQKSASRHIMTIRLQRCPMTNSLDPRRSSR